MKKYRKLFFLVPIAFILILPWIVMYLWNHVVTDIFSIQSLTYLQAMGLLLLCRILFGNFGFGNREKHRQFKEKWLNLSEEEKQRLKEEWKKRQFGC